LRDTFDQTMARVVDACREAGKPTPVDEHAANLRRIVDLCTLRWRPDSQPRRQEKRP
jgi:hypothetical protein